MQGSSSETNIGGGSRSSLKRRLDPISPKKARGKKDFDLRLSLQDPLLGKYDALNDPYCPLTHSTKFLKNLNMSRSSDLIPTMKAMDNPLPVPPEKFPKHTVPSTIIPTEVGTSGMTYSVEIKGDTPEGIAELECLKAILNREGYLERLSTVVRSLGKTFDSAVADLMDFVRVATLDTVEKIIKWREIKGDHDAAFIWNGVNYLLKMSTDLDYLMGYVVVKRWIGFSLLRNPFCVPFPLEDGVEMFSEAVLAPKHTSGSSTLSGFAIGGLTQASMRSRYTVKPIRESKSAGGLPFASENNAIPTSGGPYRDPKKTNPSSPSNRAKLTSGASRKDGGKEVSSLVLNEDMVKIRQAELVILKEEEKFGRLGRDPQGILHPIDQADARTVAYEMEKDYRKPITENSNSRNELVNLHSAKGGVGVAPQPLRPEEVDAEFFKQSDRLENTDKSVLAKTRGKSNVGGLLNPLEARGAETRAHLPLKPTIGANMEFMNLRKKKTIGDRLAEITKLKESIKQQRLALERERIRSNQRKMKSGTANSTRQLSTAGGRRSKLGTATNGSVPSTPMTPGTKNTAQAFGFNMGGDDEELSEVPSTPVHKKLRINEGRGEEVDAKPETSPTNGSPADDEEREDEGQDDFDRNGSSLLNSQELQLTRFQKEEEELSQKEKDASRELVKAERNLEYAEADIASINRLKAEQRAKHSEDRSRNIERRRRHLTADEAKRKGPIGEDSENIYDWFSVRIQSALRGWITRCWYKWYKVACHQAATIIQAGARGMNSRNRVKRMTKKEKAIVDIQRSFRGYRSRGAAAAAARGADLKKNAIQLQQWWRIMMARKRIEKKRNLDNSAKIAFDVVDTSALFLSDVKELANRIQMGLIDPEGSMPPDETLTLIRIIAMMIQEARGLVGLTSYNYMNTRFYGEVDGNTLTWEQAMHYVLRSERFLRLVRSLAFGPAARPPRLIQVPNEVQLLVQAQGKNPRWCIETFEMMGQGAKAAAQLFKWLTNILKVHSLQKDFHAFLSNSFPSWLPTFMEMQRGVRKLEVEINLAERCVARLQTSTEDIGDQFYLDAINKQIRTISKDLDASRDEFDALVGAIEKLRTDEYAKESYAILSFEENMLKNERLLIEYTEEYQTTLLDAEKGHRLSELMLPQIRDKLTIQKLQIAELESQFKILQSQVERNRGRRKGDARLPASILTRVFTCGEYWAAAIIAEIKREEFLYDAGVTQEYKLSNALLEKYKALKKDVEIRENVRQETYDEVDEMRRNHDNMLLKALEDNRQAEEKTREGFVPSEVELEEERREDEMEAQKAHIRMKQGLSDKVINDYKKRDRPVVIAFTRDVPAYAKSEIFRQLTASMPGVFVALDQEDNMGINIQQMQDIIDSHKSVILTVDHGHTRITRENFVQSFDLCLNSLIPKPCVVILMGDDSNRRSTTEMMYGCHKEDLKCMRDMQLKISMQNQHFVLYEICTPDVRMEMQRIGNELVAPSPSFIIVLEALFIIYSNHDQYTSPDKTLSAVSWRVTRSMLHSPETLANGLKAVMRGSSSHHMVTCVEQYTKHASWPPLYCKERSVNRVLELFAMYVEQWVIIEKDTYVGGGIPDKGLFKSALKNVQAVITVADPVDSNNDTDANAINKYQSWKNSYYIALRSALQDVRVLKVVQKIDSAVYNLNVYREEGVIYFDAYDPLTSRIYISTLKIEDVPNILIPNATDREKGAAAGIDLSVPEDATAMYKRLVKLLKFDTKKQTGVRRLVCKRDYDHLVRITRKISGHTVNLNVYEAGLGQVYFEVFIPKYCSKINFTMNNDIRMKLLQNSDTRLEPSITEDESDARKFVPYLIDRLKISPCSIIVDDVLNFKKRKKVDPRDCGQGFKLSLKVKGGPGRILTTFIHKFSRVMHLITLKSCSLDTRVLRIIMYQSRNKSTCEIKLNKFQRELLLGVDNDMFIQWLPRLKKRIGLDWRGKHKLKFDYTLYKSARKVANRDIFVNISIVPHDDEVVSLTLFDPLICESFSCLLNNEMMLRLIHYNLNPKAARSRKNKAIENLPSADKASQENADKAIRRIIDEESSLHPDKTKIDQIDPNEFDVPFIERLKEHGNLVNITNKLMKLIEKKTDAHDGYMMQLPFVLVFNKDDKDPYLAKFDTAMRYTTVLNKGPRGEDLQGVIRSRRQAIVVNLEDELDLLAEKMDAERRALVEANAKALEDMALALTAEGVPVEEAEGEGEEAEHAKKHIEAVADVAAEAVVENIVAKLETDDISRALERADPVDTQEKKRTIRLESVSGLESKEIALDDLTEYQREIAMEGERLVFDRGVKVNFREGKGRWHGHVSIRIYEGMSWSHIYGIGTKYRFVVYDPESSGYYEGFIRSNTHLRETLGKHAQDLAHPAKTTEMLLFLCKYRLDLVVNKYTWDGVLNEEGAPAYRVEFQSERMYDRDKVTPINANAAADADANEDKMIVAQNQRGKKILRLARKVSGMLLQLTVFEIMSPEEMAAMTKLEEDMALAALTPAGVSTQKVSDKEPTGSANPRERNRTRISTKKAPLFKIIAYEPVSKKKSLLMVPPQASEELAGGGFSPFLELTRRRELAKIVCESLLLSFPKGVAYAIFVPWSGMNKDDTAGIASNKGSTKTTAERTIKRPGKIFRGGVKVSDLDLVVTVFSQPAPKKVGGDPDAKQLVFNFYNLGASEAIEMIVTDQEQIDRNGRTILSYADGEARSYAIRRFCKNFKAEIVEELDVKTNRPTGKSVLQVQLMDVGKNYKDDYKKVGIGNPGDDIRTFGAPKVFMPLTQKGDLMYRKVISVDVLITKKRIEAAEYITSIYTISKNATPDKGLIVRMYERGSSDTVVLHIGPDEVARLCNQAEENDLLRDIRNLREELDAIHLDSMEQSFIILSEKGDKEIAMKSLLDRLAHIIFGDLGIKKDPQNLDVPYLTSMKYLELERVPD